MFVHTIPNRNSPPATLIRQSYREGTKTKVRTIANISSWSPERIAALKMLLRGEFDHLVNSAVPTSGPIFAVLYVLKAIAGSLGIPKALGYSRLGKLALFLVLARVAAPGSRLGAVRWATQHAVAEILGLGAFDEDDLYKTLDDLSKRQEKIEKRLYAEYLKRTKQPPALVLYDITSVWVEGEDNELAERGYDRDHRRGKKIILAGLVTDCDGEPLAIRVFRGNCAESTTVAEQVEILRQQFEIKEVVFVGDRGMIKGKATEALTAADIRYITALTSPQIRSLIRKDCIQLGLFDETIQEVKLKDGRRLVLRCNPSTKHRQEHRRADKLAKLETLIEKRNDFVSGSKRADPEAGLRRLTDWARQHRLLQFVSLRLEERAIVWQLDENAKASAATLDGCYVLVSDVKSEVLPAKELHDTYMRLQEVERDFRLLKTAHLELRPFFVRKESRTRGHAFVAMLGLKVLREMQQRLRKHYGTTNDDRYCMTVDEALTALSRLTLDHYDVGDGATIPRFPQPDAHQTELLAALEVALPA